MYKSGRPRTTGISDMKKKVIYAEYMKGETLQSLSKKYGCCPSSIYRFINDVKKQIASMQFHKNRPVY